MDRQPTHAHPASSAPRGALAAVAAVAALLLSVAMLASAPRAGLASLTGARIVFLGAADAAHAAAGEHPSTSGSARGARAPATNPPHAALAARRAVLVRHTSLPPPARA
ncbi:MAG: hypothetical protein FJ260_11130 [Planctomycetes bacterium]|nr:hypothetical protein [Planctomycetota bacterium]